MLRKNGSDWFVSKDHLLDMSEPEVFYGKFLSCSSELPSVRTPPELQPSSIAAGIPAPEKTSPPVTRKVHPRAFIVDDFDKCVIRRKSKNFTGSGSRVRKQLPTIDRLFAVLLRERLRTHKVFTKAQCFYLDYHKFSIKSYVLDVYYNRLSEAILIHIHNI